MSGPCGWEPLYLGCGADSSIVEDLDEDDREAVEAMAAQHLWSWTGRGYGLCEVTLRPCRADCKGSTYGNLAQPWQPALVGGQWFNIRCGQCGDACACQDSSISLTLPGPVDSITAVTLGEEVLPPEAYRVDNRRILVRTDGGGWPTCQNLAAEIGEPGAWSVSYMHGREVPLPGRVAQGRLAIEFAKALCNDDTCQLPQRVQSITRQGVTVAMLDSFDDIDEGHTGIFLIDSWVASVMKPPRVGRVLSPDVPRHRVPTWP